MVTDAGNGVEIKDVPYAWGVDGTMPKTEIRAAQATLNGKRVPIARQLLAGLFECTYSVEVRRHGSTYFVYQNNSDGAGGYTLVWVFDSKGLRQRLIGNLMA
ncbi:hypothetical protein LGH70_08370 [Hymenobacter sp. BT635]|uniref:PepSY domain-containing protein n=1 Tax=Hymenobacter nitidus TaxID=2880929 RepID=A0ABS8ABQ8_9BACT|nr:hypothetical protein [Hymenobacter nitidus]MCB2377594.1 hypothetical protein [Hymenobacter nitidus]